MTLLEWLKQQPGATVRSLAQSLGESESTVSKWVYGQRQPSLPNAVKIEDFTQGAVKPRDMISSIERAERTSAIKQEAAV